MKWNYFDESTDPLIVGIDPEVMAMLDKARHHSGCTYVVTDGKRTGTGAQDRNAVNNSAHLSGLAVDLRCRDSRSLWRMLNGLFYAGFKRIGVYFKVENGKAVPTHLHVDHDLTKDQEVCWLTVEQ